MSKLKFDDYMHIGVIVRNIEETIKSMENIFELGSYRINPFPPEGETYVQLMYHGSKGDFSARFCFIEMAGKEIELIEPVSGESLWKDFLEDHGEGIHHLKFEVESINETLSFFKSLNIKCTQYGSAVGPNSGKTWAYFDTYDRFGYVIEVLNRRIGEKVDANLTDYAEMH